MIYATTLDVDAFERDHRTRAEARQQYGLPESDFLVLAVGSYAARKGHDHLIQAVAQLRRQGRRIGAVLCGEGNPDWLRKLAEQEGIVDHVRFFQNLSEDELRLLFRTADLYCDASNTPRACLGIALTEALATRLPAIAYDTAGLPEVVRDGENGYLVPLNDVAGLASAIERISALPDSERKALGERGFERARAVFDLPTIAKALLAEIRSASSIHGT